MAEEETGIETLSTLEQLSMARSVLTATRLNYAHALRPFPHSRLEDANGKYSNAFEGMLAHLEMAYPHPLPEISALVQHEEASRVDPLLRALDEKPRHRVAAALLSFTTGAALYHLSGAPEIGLAMEYGVFYNLARARRSTSKPIATIGGQRMSTEVPTERMSLQLEREEHFVTNVLKPDIRSRRIRAGGYTAAMVGLTALSIFG